MTASDAFNTARRKARYGHKDWLVYADKSGEWFAEAVTSDTLKRCLLASGTQGMWYLIGPRRGDESIGRWWMGINMIRQRNRGRI